MRAGCELNGRGDRKGSDGEEDRDGDGSDAATSQGVPGAAACWRRQERILSGRLQSKSDPANTFIMDF